MGFEPTPGIVKIPVRHTPSLHKYVESIPRLASRYPQRLDTIYESRPLGARQVGLRCLSMWLLPQPLQGRFALRISSTYLPFTSPHYNRARQQDPRVGVVPETVKLLIGVYYIYVLPLLLEPALSLLGAGHLITFGADQPVRVSPRRTGRFLCFLR